jgi:hypothetical protein
MNGNGIKPEDYIIGGTNKTFVSSSKMGGLLTKKARTLAGLQRVVMQTKGKIILLSCHIRAIIALHARMGETLRSTAQQSFHHENLLFSAQNHNAMKLRLRDSLSSASPVQMNKTDDIRSPENKPYTEELLWTCVQRRAL